MGALFFVMPRLRRLGGPRVVRSIKRSASASPATGSAKANAIEQAALLALAFAPTRLAAATVTVVEPRTGSRAGSCVPRRR